MSSPKKPLTIIKNIFDLPEIHTEDFYLENGFVFSQEIEPKIQMTEDLFDLAMKKKNKKLFNQILNIIPMDTDLLYYYKSVLKNVEQSNCFLKNPETPPDMAIKFITFIGTHVKAEKDPDEVGVASNFSEVEKWVYNKFMICDDIHEPEYEYCGTLAKILSYNLLTIMSDVDSGCGRHLGKPLTFEGLSCFFSKSFVPIPRTHDQLNVFKNLIQEPLSSGAYGLVYGSQLDFFQVNGESLATKIPKDVSESTLSEATASICIINEYINKFPELNKAYLYCYGLFSCPSFEIRSKDKDVQAGEVRKKLCTGGGDEPNIYSVYKKINGNTLEEIIYKDDKYHLLDKLTLPKFKKIFKKLLLQLIILQEGPFKFTHNDLHCGNVMIDGLDTDDPDVYILDYGMSSYEIAGIKFANFAELRMLGNLKSQNIVSGVSDIFDFLFGIEQSPLLYSYASKIRLYLLSYGFHDRNDNEVDKNKVWQSDPHIYTDIFCPIAKGNVYNIKLLEERTYKWIYEQIQGKPFSKFDDNGMDEVQAVLDKYKVKVPYDTSRPVRQIQHEYPKTELIIWILEAMKSKPASQNMPATQFALSLLDRWEMVTEFPWTEDNYRLIGNVCIYITTQVFYLDTMTSKILEQSDSLIATVIEMSKIFLKEMNWNFLPFTFFE